MYDHPRLDGRQHRTFLLWNPEFRLNDRIGVESPIDRRQQRIDSLPCARGNW
jgi:hypothetical protein